MNIVGTIIYLIATSIIVFHYIVYPLILCILGRKPKKHVPFATNQMHPISFIIPAYNEAAIIAQKIKNTLALSYPKNLLEIIVITDGSTDGTPDILDQNIDSRIRHISNKDRLGKTCAIKKAAREAQYDLICFSDANTFLSEDVLLKLNSYFNNEEIDALFGKKVVTGSHSDAPLRGTLVYWQLESMIKKWQSNINSVTNMDGEFFAIRRNILNWDEIPDDIINDDAAITLVLQKHYARIVYADEIQSIENSSHYLSEDYKVKSRIAYGFIQIVHRYREFIDYRKGKFLFHFAAHKVLRYAMPYAIVTHVLSGLALPRPYSYVSVMESILIFSALTLRNFSVFNLFDMKTYMIIFRHYIISNIAIVHGSIQYLRSKSLDEIWQKVDRY